MTDGVMVFNWHGYTVKAQRKGWVVRDGLGGLKVTVPYTVVAWSPWPLEVQAANIVAAAGELETRRQEMAMERL